MTIRFHIESYTILKQNLLYSLILINFTIFLTYAMKNICTTSVVKNSKPKTFQIQKKLQIHQIS